jgi:hypothetical protein
VPNNCVFKDVFFGPNKITFLRRAQKGPDMAMSLATATGKTSFSAKRPLAAQLSYCAVELIGCALASERSR